MDAYCTLAHHAAVLQRPLFPMKPKIHAACDLFMNHLLTLFLAVKSMAWPWYGMDYVQPEAFQEISYAQLVTRSLPA